jgi:cold-inducible RNA-binding protein
LIFIFDDIFAFLAQDAANALRRLQRSVMKIGGKVPNVVWADNKEMVDDDILENVKTVYVRNINPDSDEVSVRKMFDKFGAIEKVVLPGVATGQKWKNFGYIYFTERSAALQAVSEMHNVTVEGRLLEATLARPQESKPSSQRKGGQDSHSRGGGGGGRQGGMMMGGDRRGGGGGGDDRFHDRGGGMGSGLIPRPDDRFHPSGHHRARSPPHSLSEFEFSFYNVVALKWG